MDHGVPWGSCALHGQDSLKASNLQSQAPHFNAPTQASHPEPNLEVRRPPLQGREFFFPPDQDGGKSYWLPSRAGGQHDPFPGGKSGRGGGRSLDFSGMGPGGEVFLSVPVEVYASSGAYQKPELYRS